MTSNSKESKTQLQLAKEHADWAKFLIDVKTQVNYGINLLKEQTEEKRKVYARLKTILDMYSVPK